MTVPAAQLTRTPAPGVAAPGATAASFGYADTALPAGSRPLPPVQRGDQGISAGERPHAERAIGRLFEAPGVDMVAMYDQESGSYELRSRTGVVRWDRWATPAGDVRYRVIAQTGENPIPSVDGTILGTLEAEAAAAGGVGKPVPKEKNSYPDILARMSQLFDHRRAPEFVYLPTPGGDPNHPGAGSHGLPDIVQSRAPLVISGPGIARGAVSSALVRHEDVAPTIADLLGVKTVSGTNATGVKRPQLLRWQDGSSLADGLAGARAGAKLTGSAERAIMFTIDGMSQTALLDEVRAGRAPNLARIINNGTMFENGSLAEYPTVTWANHNTLVTGAAPGHNGLVNNSWWDREKQREQLITDGGARNSLKTGKLMEKQVETLYEAVERSFPNVRTMAINQPSGRGADVSVLDLVGTADLARNGAKIGAALVRARSTVDTGMVKAVPDWGTNTKQDLFATALGETYWSAAKPPKLGVIEYTIVDHQGHTYGPHSEIARRALQQVDRQVGRVLDTLDRRGLADSTAIVLTADHGMEHQDTDPKKLGGWFEALDRAAADGSRTKESTRFVYVRSINWDVVGAMPTIGAAGEMAISVVNDDTATNGARPAIAGATVTVSDGAGNQWSGVSGADGLARIPVVPASGPLRVTIEHPEFSREVAALPLAGGVGAPASKKRLGAN